MNIIEHLKDTTTAQSFGLRTVEEQGILTDAGKTNCLVYYETGGWGYSSSSIFHNQLTYVLTPDYQPDPEYVNIEIISNGTCVVLKKSPPGQNQNYNLVDAQVNRNFVGFYCQFTGCVSRVDLSSVAEKCREGKKVVARFVKE